MQRRHRLTILSLGIWVVLPVIALAVYLYVFAADQYASTVGFTVRTEETGSAMEILGGLTSLSSASSSDTDVLYKFIQSQELVREMDATLNLREMFRKPAADPVFSLSRDSSIEDLVRYWARMVRIYYDPGTGLMEIESRAFDPEDARAISTEIFARSTQMINTLSAVARDDTTRYAREELDTAVERLKEARQALTLFRNETQIVDPSADIQGQMGLLNSLNAQLASSLIDLDILIETTRESDPRIEQARRKIAVIEKRMSEEREKLGVGGNHNGRAYADLIGQFEALQVDLEFAQKAYLSALSAYDTAQAEARRQSRYLAAYIEPTLAETPLYPQRAIILLISAFVLFGTWAVSVLIYYSLRDRR
ncbi:sugar transporter [Rhodobacter sp. ETT8]|uniref:Sugar transporter n=1 Tax=Pseudotabrizicola algicola TaxID=2709381 RepID=A0A6B3RNV4_9RHOB|nr:sugar transporter [Pseudotabrizicola algicola]NEX47750.1 sugar transporter [Pseudotabrizicola algicola]